MVRLIAVQRFKILVVKSDDYPVFNNRERQHLVIRDALVSPASIFRGEYIVA